VSTAAAATSATLRLVRSDDPPHSAATPLRLAPPIEQQITALQSEITDLHREVSILRRRDDSLNVYMSRMDEELRLAARLQQDFLPKTLPQVGPVHFRAMYRPAGYVSGDLYDVMRLDEHHVGFYMADAVGHGMPAALLTMFLKNALETKEIASGGYRLIPPGEALARINDALVAQNLSQATFATAVYGVIDVRTRQMTLARAGHPLPILLKADGHTEPLNPDGCLLGIFEGERFAEHTCTLGLGDRLVVYTDGVEVSFGSGGMDTQQWQGELDRRRSMTCDDLMLELANSLDSQAGSLQPKDDLTLVVVDIH
jgi:serine phosphatase RsbU (regulator of sigma subunit)